MARQARTLSQGNYDTFLRPALYDELALPEQPAPDYAGEVYLGALIDTLIRPVALGGKLALRLCQAGVRVYRWLQGSVRRQRERAVRVPGNQTAL